MNILDEIAEYARERVRHSKQIISLDTMMKTAYEIPKGRFEFENALKKAGLSFICECKKASPSKGIIAEYFPYLDIARDYQNAGADAISVLTEPKFFLGHDEHLLEIAGTVSIPCLRKDFTVDEYMIYESKILGASCVLLICAILNESQLKEYIHICNELGMSALVEAHDENEIHIALNAGARIIGVNNRNLKDFSIDHENSMRLRKIIPDDILFVSESGIRNTDDIRMIRDAGADAVLIGEVLMRAHDRRALLEEFKREGQKAE